MAPSLFVSCCWITARTSSVDRSPMPPMAAATSSTLSWPLPSCRRAGGRELGGQAALPCSCLPHADQAARAWRRSWGPARSAARCRLGCAARRSWRRASSRQQQDLTVSSSWKARISTSSCGSARCRAALVRWAAAAASCGPQPRPHSCNCTAPLATNPGIGKLAGTHLQQQLRVDRSCQKRFIVDGAVAIHIKLMHELAQEWCVWGWVSG